MADDIDLFPKPQKLAVTGESVATSALPPLKVDLRPSLMPHAQGYRLDIDRDGVCLTAYDEPGLFYGRQTIDQLWKAFPERIPGLQIEDWPDLQQRGYLLDISRDRVPTMASFFELIERLATLRYNQLQLYTEHTFAYAGHDAVWRDASPLTVEQYQDLERYCVDRFIELVPCQNVFGHMERWLTHSAYADLAECPDGWDTPWGYREPRPCSLNPADPRSFELSADLIQQLASAANSRYFNLCCDETLDLGQGRSRKLCATQGKATVYSDYLRRLCEQVQARGKTPMFFGDIVLHHPELIDAIPEHAVLLNWNYESSESFLSHSRDFQTRGLRYYNCPGTSAWASLTGRLDNAIANIRDAAEAGTDCEAEGLLLTDWGDYGHWQPPVLSLPPLIYGAGVAWSLQNNSDPRNIAPMIGRLIADDPSDGLGKIVMQIGRINDRMEVQLANATWWFRYLQEPASLIDAATWHRIADRDVHVALEGLASAQAALESYEPIDNKVRIVKRELLWCVELAGWVCRRVAGGAIPPSGMDNKASAGGRLTDASEIKALMDTHKSLWLNRSRIGGLADSIAKLGRWAPVARTSIPGEEKLQACQ